MAFIPDISVRSIADILEKSGFMSAEDCFGHFARLLSHTEDAVFIKDVNSRYLMVNSTFAAIIGRPEDAIIGLTDQEVAPGYAANGLATDRWVISTGQAVSYEVLGVGASTGRVFYTCKAPVRDPDGRLMGVIGISRDIADRKRVEEALRVSESRLAATQSIAHLGTWEWNLHTNEVIWSEESYRIFGVDSRSFTPRFEEVCKLLPPEQVVRVRGFLSAAARRGEPFAEDFLIRRPNGEERYLHTEGVVTVYAADGTALIMSGTNLDVTERKRTEIALRRSESNFAHAQRVAQVGSWEWALDDGEIVMSEEAQRITSLHAADWSSVSREQFLSFVHTDDRTRISAAMDATLERGQPYDETFRFRGPDGVERILHSLGDMHTEYGSNRPLMTGVVQDVTERQRMQDALAASRDELRDLMQHLQHVQEEERRRIAREIHDEFGAVFTAANLSLARLANQLRDADPSVRELLASTKEMILNAGRSLDDIVNGLHPQMLGHLGLAATVEWYAGEFAKRTGLRVHQQIPTECGALGEQQSIAVFRCLQESLTNVAKHAHATVVRIELTTTTTRIKLVVLDNGKGIDTRQLAAPDAYGIRGMGARVRNLGGTLVVEPGVPKGTRMTLVLPRRYV
jgi:PAS domain S-box-containing protein